MKFVVSIKSDGRILVLADVKTKLGDFPRSVNDHF